MFSTLTTVIEVVTCDSICGVSLIRGEDEADHCFSRAKHHTLNERDASCKRGGKGENADETKHQMLISELNWWGDVPMAKAP